MDNVERELYMITKFYIAPLIALSFVSANSMDFTDTPEFKETNRIGQIMAKPLIQFDEDALERELAALTDDESLTDSTVEIEDTDLELLALELEIEQESAQKKLSVTNAYDDFMKSAVLVNNNPMVLVPVQSYSIMDYINPWNWNWMSK